MIPPEGGWVAPGINEDDQRRRLISIIHCIGGLQRINSGNDKQIRRKHPKMDCRAVDQGLQCNPSGELVRLANRLSPFGA